MTQLKCNVATCASNKENCCCRPAIKVQGKSACKCCDTRCESFTNKTNECSNATHFDNVNNSLEVKCTAENCVYNAGGACSAQDITIDGHGAKEMSQTECASFRQSN